MYARNVPGDHGMQTPTERKTSRTANSPGKKDITDSRQPQKARHQRQQTALKGKRLGTSNNPENQDITDSKLPRKARHHELQTASESRTTKTAIS